MRNQEMKVNKWFSDFLESFGTVNGKRISDRQYAIFAKYGETVTDRRTETAAGKTELYKYRATKYFISGKAYFQVTITENADNKVTAIKAEIEKLDNLLDTDISDSEYDAIENRIRQLYKEIGSLEA